MLMDINLDNQRLMQKSAYRAQYCGGAAGVASTVAPTSIEEGRNNACFYVANS